MIQQAKYSILSTFWNITGVHNNEGVGGCIGRISTHTKHVTISCLSMVNMKVLQSF